MRSTSTLRADTRPFAAGIERMFGFTPILPRARRSLVYALAGFAILATGAAAAAWQVHDRDTHRQVQALRESVGGSSSITAVGELQKVSTRLRVDHKPNQPTTAIVAEPAGTAKLDGASLSAAQTTIGRMCPSGVLSTLGRQQRQLCRELVQTERAQYMFSLQMFKRAAQHHARLTVIEQRRRALGAEDYADLQSNSNELLALTALMDNDRDRYQTYMRAYEARIAHIRHTQVALTRNVFKGRGSVNLPGSAGIL